MKRYFESVFKWFKERPKTEVNTCYICGNDEPKYKYFSPIDVYECGTCGFVWNGKQPTFRVLDKFYEDSEPMTIWAKIKETMKEDIRQSNKFDKVVEWIAGNEEIRNLLDIGCGNGFFMSLINDIGGITCTGVEPNKEARQLATKAGHLVSCSMDGVFETFDMITLFGVLEHVKDPGNKLEAWKKYLNKDGYLAVIVPNVNSLVVKYAGGQTSTFCPQHLWYYNEDTLTTLMKRGGFSKIKTWTEEAELEPIKKVRAGLNPYEELNYLKINDNLYNEEDILDAKLGYKLIGIFKLED